MTDELSGCCSKTDDDDDGAHNEKGRHQEAVDPFDDVRPAESNKCAENNAQNT